MLVDIKIEVLVSIVYDILNDLQVPSNPAVSFMH